MIIKFTTRIAIPNPLLRKPVIAPRTGTVVTTVPIYISSETFQGKEIGVPVECTCT